MCNYSFSYIIIEIFSDMSDMGHCSKEPAHGNVVISSAYHARVVDYRTKCIILTAHQHFKMYIP